MMVAIEPEPNPDTLFVSTTMAELLRRNDWCLLSIEEMTERVLERLNQVIVDTSESATTNPETARPWSHPPNTTRSIHPSSDPLKLAALWVYSDVLYHAFANSREERRQARAYQELFAFVLRAMRKYATDIPHDEREELTYQVVANLYLRIVQPGELRIQVPGALLAIAIQQVRNEVRRWRMIGNRWGTQFLSPAAPEQTLDLLPDPDQTSQPEAAAERHELRLRIRQLFGDTLKKFRRARMQLYVVWLHSIEDLDYTSVAQQLGMTTDNIHLLHARGLKRLRSLPGFHTLANEVFIRKPDDDKEHGA